MAKKSKINVLQATEGKDLHLFWNKPITENRVEISKNESAEFSYLDIFNLIIYPRSIIGRLLRRKKQIKCLIHREGANKCVKLAKNNLIDPLTNEEARKITLRNIALGLGQFQPISTTIALIIIILLIIAIIGIFLNLGGVRIG